MFYKQKPPVLTGRFGDWAGAPSALLAEMIQLLVVESGLIRALGTPTLEAALLEEKSGLVQGGAKTLPNGPNKAAITLVCWQGL